MALLSRFPHKGSLIRFESVGTGAMDSKKVLQVVRADIDIWVQNASTAEITQWGRKDEDISHRVFFNADPEAKVGWFVKITSGPSFVGDVYQLKAEGKDRSAGLGRLWRCMGMEEKSRRILEQAAKL